jgi:5-methylcytosine-specific restriction endonuclease McrA
MPDEARCRRPQCRRIFILTRPDRIYCSPRCQGSITSTRKREIHKAYGTAHQKRRAALLEDAYGTRCAHCHLVMLPGQALDFDHAIPVALGGVSADRFLHAGCNRSRGQAVRKARQQLKG